MHSIIVKSFLLGDRISYLTPREESLADIQEELHASLHDGDVFDAMEMVACQLRVLKLETGRCVMNVGGENEFSPGDQDWRPALAAALPPCVRK